MLKQPLKCKHLQKNTQKNNKLELLGVKENNLKNIDLVIDHNTFNVITGPSGSGKTSLAFDTIHAEGGRRYIETFSPYTRQFLDRLKQPELKSCTCLLYTSPSPRDLSTSRMPSSA